MATVCSAAFLDGSVALVVSQECDSSFSMAAQPSEAGGSQGNAFGVDRMLNIGYKTRQRWGEEDVRQSLRLEC